MDSAGRLNRINSRLRATAYELLRGGEPEQRSFSPHLVQREST
jgi:hypothetical protein